MSFIAYLIATFFIGLFVGAFGRLALPGPDPMTMFQTALVGIGGSLLAGVLVWFLTGGHYAAGLPLSILGATFIVYVIRRSRGGSLRRPAPGPGTTRRRW